MKKDKVIASLNELPDEFTIEELIQRMLFIEKVEKGIEQADKGKTIPLEEVKKQFKTKWSK
jgi:hypothetical protein